MHINIYVSAIVVFFFFLVNDAEEWVWWKYVNSSFTVWIIGSLYKICCLLKLTDIKYFLWTMKNKFIKNKFYDWNLKFNIKILPNSLQKLCSSSIESYRLSIVVFKGYEIHTICVNKYALIYVFINGLRLKNHFTLFIL